MTKAMALVGEASSEPRGGLVRRILASVGLVVGLSLVLVLAAGLVVPFPAVAVAALRIGVAHARGREPSLLPELAAGVRERWKASTLLGLAVVAVGGVAVLDVWYMMTFVEGYGPLIAGGVLGGAFLAAVVAVYVALLLAMTDLRFGEVVRTAARLALGRLGHGALAVLAIVGIPMVVSISPILLILVAPGLVALTVGRVGWAAIGPLTKD